MRAAAVTRASAVPTVTLLTVTPSPLTVTVVAPGTKPVPVTVSVTLVPRSADVGLRLVSVGAVG